MSLKGVLHFFISFAQGERVAELILRHARASECQDVPRFKKEMAQLVDHALSNTLSLGKVLNQICTLICCSSAAVNTLLCCCVQLLRT